MKKTTVVIPNYNGKQYLENCIRSLLAQQVTEGFDILVIDNGSSDGSEALTELLLTEEKASIRREQAGIGLRQIRFRENTGFCRAVNAGIREAGTPYVLLLNNDTEVLPGFVEALTEAMDADRTLFAASSRMRSMKEPHLLDDAGDFYSALGWAFARGKGKDAEAYDCPAMVFAACGGASIYRKEMLVKLGGFDENHFAYLEDIDIAYRARIHGWRSRYEPEAQVLHAGSATTGSAHNPFKVRLSARNSLYLAWKNMPLVQLLLNAPFLLLGTGIKYVYFCKKRLGSAYRSGLREGIALCLSKEGKAHKVKFRWKHTGHYAAIQIQLWAGMVRRLMP